MKNFFKKLFWNNQNPAESHIVDAWTNSSDYWERRYSKGGNSGIGSYGRLAEFKAEVLNRFVKENNINTEMHVFPVGGHGLALSNELTLSDNGSEDVKECQIWTDLAITWAKNL